MARLKYTSHTGESTLSKTGTAETSPTASTVSMTERKFSFWTAVVLVSIVKLMYIKSYRSTDFEVHRNWLAVTHSLPLRKWYYDETSEWTLDYPPFFAYFEWVLSQLAQFVDKEMLSVTNLNYASDATIFFQKISVILVDFILAQGVRRCADAIRLILPGGLYSRNTSITLFALIFMNGGLFIVDHIHFQYNGFLFGILLLSIASILQDRYFVGTLLFAILLCFKHIFLYISPAFGVYLFARHCVKPRSARSSWFPLHLGNLIGLASIVGVVLGASFGPFYAHLPQILKRLFPFKRGLSHAYWAPNVWAGYNSLDLVLNFVKGKAKSGVTGGLVGEHPLTVLPQVQPIHTFALTLIFILPALYKIWKNPSETNFVYAVIATAWTSFMFGYHVHEKAILNVIIPLALIAILEPKLFVMTLIPGTFSLFPLLFTPFEIVHKFLIALFHITVSLVVIPSVDLRWFEKFYIFGFIPLFIVENAGPFFFTAYPFLPLIAVSDYCFIGLFYAYLEFYWKFLVQKRKPVKGKSLEREPSLHVKDGKTKGHRKKKFF